MPLGFPCKEIICGGLVFLDGQNEGWRRSVGSERRGLRQTEKEQLASWRRPAHCLPHCQTSGNRSAGVHCRSGTANPLKSAVLNSSKMSHSRSFDLLLTTPERGPSRSGLRPATALTWPANASGVVANSCSTTEPSPLPAEATAVAMPAASLMPPSSTSSRPTSWHEERRRRSSRSARGSAPLCGGPSRRGPLIARASDPDVAATIQAAVARRRRSRRQLPAGGRQTRLSRRLLDSPSDDNNDTGRTAAESLKSSMVSTAAGGPAEDEEDDDATIVEDESTAAHCSSCRAVSDGQQVSPNSLDDAPSAASITAAAAPPARPPRRRSFGPLSASYPSPQPQPPAQTAPTYRSRPARSLSPRCLPRPTARRSRAPPSRGTSTPSRSGAPRCLCRDLSAEPNRLHRRLRLRPQPVLEPPGLRLRLCRLDVALATLR
uniref:Serine/arginine repetitive matrix protein 1-like n=1 Tax=Macrostomum lignano TaxID=282301 RepID=A0A1I8FKA9_9PLAT